MAPNVKFQRKKYKKPEVALNNGFNPGTPFIKESTPNQTAAVEKRETSLYLPKENDKEGMDYLNISKHSFLNLGRELNPGFGIKFNTPFGKAGSVRNFMEYVVTPNYPIEILRKTKLTKIEIDKLPRKKVNVTNYWAIVAIAVLTRIKEDKAILSALADLPVNCKITSFNKFSSEFGGVKTESVVPNVKMRSYIDIIKFIIKQIKISDINNQEVIDKIISTFSNDKTLPLFHNCPVNVKIKNK